MADADDNEPASDHGSSNASDSPHQHSHGHGDHSHGVSLARAGKRHAPRLAAAFVIIAVFFVVEAVAGVLTNSLALLSDAGHMLTDVIGLGMALAAIQLASRFESRTSSKLSNHTFGLYRLEILAAFVNALLLCGVALWVLVEAIRRLGASPEVLEGPMLIVAVLGLLANIVAFALLRDGSEESINIEAAYLEVLADLIGSVGVIIGALLLRYFNWTWVDPVIGAAIGLWILPRTWRLGRNAVRILLQAAPEHLDLDKLHDELASIEGVVDVHDLHVWTLTSEMEAASAHLTTGEGADAHAVLDRARDLLHADYGITHGTFQVEPDTHVGCHEMTW